MRSTILVAVLSVTVASCAGDEARPTTTSGTQGPASPTSAPGTTEPPEPTTTSTQGSPSTTIGAPPGTAFVISEIGLGDNSMVVITNIGSDTGTLGGHWLCQRPDYYEFSNVDVGPGESVAIATTSGEVTPPEGVTLLEGVATIGPLDAGDGEVGLYNATIIRVVERHPQLRGMGPIRSWAQWDRRVGRHLARRWLRSHDGRHNGVDGKRVASDRPHLVDAPYRVN